ncbi:MAG: hypothetical protein R3358_08455, partial [Woeseiaceae bacterium]|nr:hypothetical protein [Woeseiaceae bacterium]
MKILMAAIPCALAVLCGCSGGAPGNETTGSPSGASSTSASEETVHFEGNWVGTLTSDQEQHSSTAILLVNGWGEFRLIADGMQFVGWPRRTETSLAGTVTGIRAAGTSWNDGSTSGIFDIGGTITGNDLIDGTYLGAGDNGVFTLTWVAGDESRGEAIAGSWVQYDANENIVAS